MMMGRINTIAQDPQVWDERFTEQGAGKALLITPRHADW